MVWNSIHQSRCLEDLVEAGFLEQPDHGVWDLCWLRFAASDRNFLKDQDVSMQGKEIHATGTLKSRH